MKKRPQMAVITNFSTYEPRAEAVGEFFTKKGFKVTYIFSDFLHRAKKKRDDKKVDHIYLHTKQYSKNISPQRLLSHWKFSKDLEKVLLKNRYDVVYLLIPANSLLSAAQKVKKVYKTKLVVDVIDLWPESMIPEKFANFPLVKQWRQLRDKGLDAADWVFTECDLYNETLKIPENKRSTLYWKKGPQAKPYRHEIDSQGFKIAYIGSINNIIDIDFICEILTKLKQIKPVTLKIIGNGEKKNDFITAVKNVGVQVKYYGPIYDDNEKQEILKDCCFGLNVMKSGVNVGLTMKSVEYFYYGIPIINNIPGDTRRFVDEYKVGVNINDGDLDKKLGKSLIPKVESFVKVQKTYNNLFSDQAFEDQLEKTFTAWKTI